MIYFWYIFFKLFFLGPASMYQYIFGAVFFSKITLFVSLGSHGIVIV